MHDIITTVAGAVLIVGVGWFMRRRALAALDRGMPWGCMVWFLAYVVFVLAAYALTLLSMR